MKLKTTIEVTGCGGCINYEMEVIKRAFESLGIKVIIENDHEKDPTYNFSDEKELPTLRNKEQWETHLIAHHLPWGG